MPWTLYRYILMEMLKLLAVSLAVLLAVIAMALAIKPLSDGLLGALQLLKFIFYTAPTILDIALPFAGAFASTLVFCRMMADNEIVACRASGMSYVVILTPVLILGAALTLLMLLLSSWVVPNFYRMAAEMVQRDVVTAVVSSLKEGKTFRQKNLVLYAEAVDEVDFAAANAPQPSDILAPQQLAEGVQPLRLIMLQGVAFGRLDRDHRLRSDSTAERADLLLCRRGDESWISLRLLNATHYSASLDDPWGSVSSVEYVLPLANPFRDKEDFLSASELRQLAHEPDRLSRVSKPKEVLAGLVATEKMRQMVVEELDATRGRGSLTLLGVTDQDRYIVTAPKVERKKTQVQLRGEGTRRVEVEYFQAGVPRHRARANEAIVQTIYEDGVLRLRLVLNQCDVEDLRRAGRRTQHAEFTLWPLRWRTPVAEEYLHQPVFDLLRMSRDEAGAPMVKWASEKLWNEIAELGRKVTALQHRRAASSTAAVLVLLLGAMLSLQLEGRLPLVIYFWSFGVTAVSVILARTGDSLLSNMDFPAALGIVTIWSGNLVLLTLLLFVGRLRLRS